MVKNKTEKKKKNNDPKSKEFKKRLEARSR